MDKFKKYLLTSLVAVVCILMATTSVTAWTQDCDTIDEQMSELYDEMWSSTGACTLAIDYGLWNYATECNSLRNQYNEMQEWTEENCGEEECEPLFTREYMNYAYKVDNSPYYVFKYYYNGEIMFCIDPTTIYNECADYSATPSTLTAEQYTKIATAASLYKEEPSNTHYVAAQMYIWKVLGYNRTVNGQGINYYWNGFEDKVEAALDGKYTSSSTTTVEVENIEVDFADDNIMVDLGDSFTNKDTNSNLSTSTYTASVSDGSSATISSNAVSATNTSIWPSTKTYTVTPKTETVTETTATANRLDGLGTIYMANYSQSLFSFDGYLESGTTLVEVTNYIGDTFTTTLKTGTLNLTKLNEYFENAEDGHSFMIWYAVEDENGTAIDDNGTTWSKYEVFLSEEDWENGLAESVFTTDADGNITISLPSGGMFDDVNLFKRF